MQSKEEFKITCLLSEARSFSATEVEFLKDLKAQLESGRKITERQRKILTRLWKYETTEIYRRPLVEDS